MKDINTDTVVDQHDRYIPRLMSYITSEMQIMMGWGYFTENSMHYDPKITEALNVYQDVSDAFKIAYQAEQRALDVASGSDSSASVSVKRQRFMDRSDDDDSSKELFAVALKLRKMAETLAAQYVPDVRPFLASQ
jgi:hypothetical protein